MKIHKLLLSTACALVATMGISSASSVGYTEYVGTYWSLWDTFPMGGIGDSGPIPAQFAQRAATSSSGNSDARASFAFANSGNPPGVLLLPDGAGTNNSEIYSGAGSTSWGIDGVAVSTISSLVLQVKQNVTPRGQSPVDISGLSDEFAPTVNGIGATSAAPGTLFVEGTQQYLITTWTWSGLNIGAGDYLSLVYSNSGSHISLDGMRLDSNAAIQAVPEPSTYLLLAVGLGVVFWRFRRPQQLRN